MRACLAEGSSASVPVSIVFRGADGSAELARLGEDVEAPPSAMPCLRRALDQIQVSPFDRDRLPVRYTITLGEAPRDGRGGSSEDERAERALEVRNRGSADICTVRVQDRRGGVVVDNLLPEREIIAPGEDRTFDSPPEGRFEYVTETCRGHTVQNIRLSVDGPDAWMASDFTTAALYPFNFRLGFSIGALTFTATCDGCGTTVALTPLDAIVEIGALFGGAWGIGLQVRGGIGYVLDAEAVSFVGSAAAGLIELQSSLFLGPGVLLVEDTPYFAIAASGNGVKLTDQLFFVMNYVFGLREESGYWVLVNQASLGISWTS